MDVLLQSIWFHTTWWIGYVHVCMSSLTTSRPNRFPSKGKYRIIMEDTITLPRKAACQPFCLWKLFYYDMILLPNDILSFMLWHISAVEEDWSVMFAPVTCLLLFLLCGCPSGECDETITADIKICWLLWTTKRITSTLVSRSEKVKKKKSSGTFSNWVQSKMNIVWSK